MDEDFIIQAVGASVLAVFVVWFLNPFAPAYDLRANLMNFVLMFSCSLLSLAMLQFGEKEFKTRITFESFSLLAGVVVLSAVVSYGAMGYGMSILSTPYPLLTAIFFLLPILQLFIRERL